VRAFKPVSHARYTESRTRDPSIDSPVLRFQKKKTKNNRLVAPSPRVDVSVHSRDVMFGIQSSRSSFVVVVVVVVVVVPLDVCSRRASRGSNCVARTRFRSFEICAYKSLFVETRTFASYSGDLKSM
jgi:hypothetical protein